MNKPGAPRGNTNALKGDTPKLTRIQFRCTSKQKRYFSLFADANGLSVSDWIIKTLDRGMLNNYVCCDDSISKLDIPLGVVSALIDKNILTISDLLNFISHQATDADIKKSLSLACLSLAKS